MKQYIGIKVVKAVPMTVEQAEFVLGRKIDMSKHENEKEGYLVEYEDGYRSFSPKSVFENAYEPVGSGDYAPMQAMFKFWAKDISPETLQEEFAAWQQAMLAKYDVTFPDFKILG